MNPTAGSFAVTPRMQRHFATFALAMPGPEVVRAIYGQLLDAHFSAGGAGGGFEANVARLAPKLVDATIALHRLVRFFCFLDLCCSFVALTLCT